VGLAVLTRIAYALGLSRGTVRTHLRRALGKLGVSSRFDLVDLRLKLTAT
jgi:DNA-binding CsgD family transcriptional regulator